MQITFQYDNIGYKNDDIKCTYQVIKTKFKEDDLMIVDEDEGMPWASPSFDC